MNKDLDVLIPQTHLQALVDEGKIGSMASTIVSFMGYQPDATQVVDETTPAVVAVAQAEQADAVLLVPA